MALKILDLCSGVGGFALAHEMCRDPDAFETVAFVEIDPWCRDLLAKRFPRKEIFDDLRTVGLAELRERGIDRIDVVCAGFPCQPFSVAGRKLGFADPRTDIFGHVVRIFREVGAKYIILENVPAVLSHVEGIAGALAEVCDFFEWDIVSAEETGACHVRKRWWCIGHAANASCQRDGRSPQIQAGRAQLAGGDQT